MEASLGVSYAVHPNMKSHTGGGMSHGHGIIYTRSSKPKLIMICSTAVKGAGACDYSLQNEAKMLVVRACDCFLQNKLVKMLLEGQEYNIQEIIVYQGGEAMRRGTCTTKFMVADAGWVKSVEFVY